MGTDHDLHRQAARQYWAKLANIEIAREMHELGQAPGRSAEILVQLFCTCGRGDCQQMLELAVEDYGRIQREPHRFLVFPGHETAINDVVESHDDYYVVEVKAEYRRALPAADVRYGGEPRPMEAEEQT